MNFLNSHLTDGFPHTDGDGRAVILFSSDSHTQFESRFCEPSMSEVRISLMNEYLPLAHAFYKVNNDGVVLNSQPTYVHESLRGRGISTQLFVLQTELAIMRWRELLGKEIYGEDFPDVIQVKAGPDSAVARGIFNWLNEIFNVNPNVVDRNGDIYDENHDPDWYLELSGHDVEIIWRIASDVLSEELLEGFYTDLYT